MLKKPGVAKVSRTAGLFFQIAPERIFTVVNAEQRLKSSCIYIAVIVIFGAQRTAAQTSS